MVFRNMMAWREPGLAGRASRGFAAAVAWALLLHGCSFGDDFLYGTISETGFDTKTVDMINVYRGNEGLEDLAWSDPLHELALEHAQSMDDRGEMDHDGFDSRMARSGSSYCVENCGVGALTSSEVLKMWQDSSGHNENLLNSGIRNVGVAHSGPYAVYFACY